MTGNDIWPRNTKKSCNGPHPWQKWAVCELQGSGKIVLGSPPCTAQLRAGATCQTLPREKKEADWRTDWKTGIQIEKARSTDSPRKAWGPSKVGVDDKEETEKTHRMSCSIQTFPLKPLRRQKMKKCRRSLSSPCIPSIWLLHGTELLFILTRSHLRHGRFFYLGYCMKY